MPTRVVILGGGFAGIAAMRELRGRDDLEVCLVDGSDVSVFWPLLPDMISGRIAQRHIEYPLTDACGRGNATFVHARVEQIDPRASLVQTSAGQIEFDYLLIALGAATDYHGRGDMRHRTVGFKSLGEARFVRDRAWELVQSCREWNKIASIVIVGGGYTGFEVASNTAAMLSRRLGVDLAELSRFASILIVEQAPDVLRNVSPKVRRWARGLMGGFGVEVRTGLSVEQITDDGSAVLTDGSRLDDAMVVWCAGVTAPPPVARLEAPMARGRLLVEPTMQVQGLERVFAAGDVAAVLAGDDREPLRMSVQFSLSGGAHAAGSILRDIDGRARRQFQPRDPGYIVPLAPGAAAGSIMGVKLRGRIPSFLHYFMSSLRSWGWANRLGIIRDLARRKHA